LKRARAVALGASARLGIWNAHIVHDFVPLFGYWCLHAESPALGSGQAGRQGRCVIFSRTRHRNKFRHIRGCRGS
jgi:hypothetical protein